MSLEETLQAHKESLDANTAAIKQWLEANGGATASADDSGSKTSAKKTPAKKTTTRKKAADKAADAPTQQETKEAFANFLSATEQGSDERQERKDFCLDIIGKCKDENGKKAEKSGDICAEQRAWAIGEIKAEEERIAAEGDTGGAAEDDDDI